jgi:glutamate synthase (NADPH/NADH) large chain
MQAFPPPQGLYDGQHEHDACGVAFVATLTGEPSHDIVDKALTALRNLEHRGAAGAESNSGDGAGILMQVPDRFFRAVTAEAGFELPAARSYAVGTAFIPGDVDAVAKTRARIE